MVVRFVCPHCGVVTEIAEKYIGQTGPCAHCGKAITIPLPEGEVEVLARSGRRTPLVVFAVVLVVAMAGSALLVVGLVKLGARLLPALSGHEAAAERALCADNLRRIAEAMSLYEQANGCFPPAYLADKHGKPMHSWRVLLLPYLDEQDLADRYNFNEPWNSANNRAVTDVTLGLFQCPSQPGVVGPVTNYMMVVGSHTISNGREPRRIAQITDGLGNTIMLVEVADSTTPWAEPEDLHFDKLHFTINGRTRRELPEISSHHPHGANVAFCDGSVRLLKDSTSPHLVKALLTVDGGEAVPEEY
jgi:prepilin-type processing-associated H-X9-DG protein